MVETVQIGLKFNPSGPVNWGSPLHHVSPQEPGEFFLDPFCFKYTPRLIRPCLMGKILVVSGLENVANAYRFTKFQRNRSKLLCSWRGRKAFGFRALTTPSTHRGSPSFYHHLPIEALTQQPKPVPIIIALGTNHHFLIFPLRNPNFSSAVSIFSCHQCKGKDLNSLES